MISRLTIPFNKDTTVREIEELNNTKLSFSWEKVRILLEDEILTETNTRVKSKAIRCTDQGIELVTE